MVLKLYYDFLSQPSRALYIFFKKAGIPFEPCVVDLASRVHFTKEFKENLNKLQKVPFIHHDNFKLPESIAIVRYVAREFPLADHWYPKDSKKQAEADIYLEWQHMNVRLLCASYFQHKWLQPKLKGKEPNAKRVEFYKELMIKCLEQFEECFLENKKFISGNEISYADIAAACEIEQPRIAGYNPKDHFPKIKRWIEDVRQECNPYYDEAHGLVNKLAGLANKQLQGKL